MQPLNSNESKLSERDLHSYFVNWANSKLKAYCRTINDKINLKDGMSKDRNPDIVFFTPTAFLNSTLLKVCSDNGQSIIKALVGSAELKLSINKSSYSDYFNQAWSNSMWAHEAYLVAKDIPVENKELMEKMKKKSDETGVGLIHLNIEDFEKTNIIFSAQKRDEIDLYHANDLMKRSPDFRSFMDGLEIWLDKNKIYSEHFDLVDSDYLEHNSEEQVEEKTEQSEIISTIRDRELRVNMLKNYLLREGHRPPQKLIENGIRIGKFDNHVQDEGYGIELKKEILKWPTRDQYEKGIRYPINLNDQIK